MSNYYSYTLDGVAFDDPIIGIESVSRSIIREWQGTGIENILRKKSDSTLTFTGNAYNYLCSKNLCDRIEFELFNSEGQQFYLGDIYTPTIIFNVTQRTAETPIRDTTWSSLLRNRANLEAYLLYKKSLDCSADITAPTEYNFTFFNNLGAPYGVKRLGFKVLDVLQFLVNYYTNNQITVVSNYLSNNEYAIIRGSSLGQNLTKSKYFSISFETLFTELRKKLNLYAKIDGNTLYIEQEADFFGTTNSMIISEIPYGFVKEVDFDRIVTSATVGSSNTDISDDYTSNLPFVIDKWNEVKFSNCSCTFEKDNTLELSSDFIIDSDVIHDTLANGGNEEDIFLIELSGGEPAAFIQPPFAAFWYNNSLRNSFVIQRWENYLLNCIVTSTENNLWNASGTPFENNQSFNLVFDNFVFTALTCTLFQHYRNINIDPLNAGTQPSQGAVCNATSQQYTMYTIQNTAKYAFRASRVFKWDTQGGTFATVNRFLIIEVYTNSSLSSLAFSWQTAESGVVIPPNGLPENPLYYVDSMEVVTPVWTIPAGHVVVVKFSYLVTVGVALSISIVDGVFEYAAELLQCENKIDDFNLNVPYKYTFEKEFCNSDFDSIDANKEGVIKIAGNDMYVSEVTQDLNGRGNFILLSNENICCDGI